MAGGKGAGQEFAKARGGDPARGRGHGDGHIRRTEFGKFLATAAAGADGLLPAGDHQHLGDLALAGGHHGGDGPGLGACALGIGDVFHVAAGEDAPRGSADRGADLEAGIGGMGALSRGGCGCDEILHGGGAALFFHLIKLDRLRGGYKRRSI